MNSEFSRNITLQRKERKISQKQAAADLGISQALLSHYEKGIRECGLDFLTKIADYYNVSCDYLLGRASSPNKTYPDETLMHSEECAQKIKLISNSAETLISVSEKHGSADMLVSVTDSIMISLYKIFRIIYNSNSENDPSLFRIPETYAENYCDSAIFRKMISIKKSGEESPVSLTSSDLANEFSSASSLLSLIKRTEEKISENFWR